MLCEEAATRGVLLKTVFLKISQNELGICQGNGVFMELGHFDKHSPTTLERRALQVKIGFFLLEKL